jgi:oligopeptide transport system ATP-binding protein
MLQRAMIAMAIACEPSILIADEPTTALDVTIQAQILDLLKELQQKTGMAIILITHNLGVVAHMADEVAVMYAGRIVEKGSAETSSIGRRILIRWGCIARCPDTEPGEKHGLQPIEGTPPDLFDPPKGCSYFARCPYAMRLCENNDPPRFYVQAEHYSHCWLHHPSSLAACPNCSAEKRRETTG